MSDGMSAPDSDTLWKVLAATLMGGVTGAMGSWIRDKIKSAILDAQFKSFLIQYQLDRNLDREINNRRHEENKGETQANRNEIGKVADTVSELNRYLRNGFREKGH
jgi:hypothetical protein